jgi:hypothetical protein
LTSELNERRWAVLSERGREVSGLSYAEAAGLVARLRAERLSGLCVVTDDAAAHLHAAKSAPAKPTKGGGDAPKADPAASKPRRSRKKA